MKPLQAGLALATLVLLAVAAPATARSQAATKMATCKDGTTSKAGRGACSGHGGVADAAAKTTTKESAKVTKEPMKTADTKTSTASKSTSMKATTPPAKTSTAVKTAPATTPPAKAEGKATAKCTDGTMSYAKSHTGACSSHGGVAEWLDGTKKKTP